MYVGYVVIYLSVNYYHIYYGEIKCVFSHICLHGKNVAYLAFNILSIFPAGSL